MSKKGGKTTVTKTTTTVTRTTGGGNFDSKGYEKNGLSQDEVMEIKEAFDLFDTDHSGTIDTEELKSALSNLGIDAKNQTLQNMMNDTRSKCIPGTSCFYCIITKWMKLLILYL